MEQVTDQEREAGGLPSSSRGTYIKWAAGVILFAAVFFACGFIFARLFPKKNDPFSQVQEVIGTVRSHFFFYSEETDRKIAEGALKGVAAYLDDPYAHYYTAEEYASLQKTDSGNYVGLGIVLQMQEDDCVITSVYENAPAALAGVMAQDILLSVNGTNTVDLELSEITPLFCCDEGAENVLVIRRGEEKLTLTVIAGEVYTPYVHARMLSGNIGYIHISGFHGKVVEETKEAVAALQEQGMDRLVLDLRDDPGGMLTDVRNVADIFLPADCVIATLRSRTDKEKVYKTRSEGLSLPVAMIVNGGSASASELLAGAMHDNGAAVLFGTKTYGKGIVQTYYELQRGEFGAFKMTTEAYYTPAGICIQDEGITPDHIVEMPGNISYSNIYELTPEEDPQLRAAVDYLNTL